MATEEGQAAHRAMARHVTLAMLGVFALYGADEVVVTAIARGVADAFRAQVPGFGRSRRRGRAALRALLDELERVDEPT